MVYAWENEIIQGDTKASAVYTFDVEEDMHISGTPTVTVKDAADRGTGILSAMLVDVAPDGMNAVVLEEYGEGVATEVVEAGGLGYGAGLENKDLIQFAQTSVDSVDPEVTYWPEKVTNFTVDNSGTFVSIPVR